MNPYEGTTEVPPDAGVRTDVPRESEHRPGGMLNGALVHIRYCDTHGRHMATGKIQYWGSVPAAHALVLVKPREQDGEWERKIIMAHAITEIDPAGEA